MSTADRLLLAAPDVADVMGARTLANSHPSLLQLLTVGASVLDVGCGPGTLTAEMARRAKPGAVVGMDVNPEMVRAAEESHPPGVFPNLIFYAGDVRESAWDGEFDVVNAARTLQWIRDPEVALARMTRASVAGGSVVVLEVDHRGADWSHLPRPFARFHNAFLDWRQAVGLDNAIAGRLPRLFERAGLADVVSTPRITTVRADDPDFFRVAGAWRMMIEGRGRQIVTAGLLTEAARRGALDAFTEWMQDPDATHTVHEACVVGRRP